MPSVNFSDESFKLLEDFAKENNTSIEEVISTALGLMFYLNRKFKSDTKCYFKTSSGEVELVHKFTRYDK